MIRLSYYKASFKESHKTSLSKHSLLELQTLVSFRKLEQTINKVEKHDKAGGKKWMLVSPVDLLLIIVSVPEVE